MKNILISFFLFTNIHLIAQQKPSYGQYIVNAIAINPAVTGIQHHTDVKMNLRKQWLGIDNAPQTVFLTVNTPILHQYDENANNSHHGLGLQIVSDKVGLLNNTSFLANYAYHLKVNEKGKFSLGIGAGVNKYNFANENNTFDLMNTPDPSIGNVGDVGKASFDLNAGMFYYTSNYFIGVSAMQLMPSKIEFKTNANSNIEGRKVPHLFFYSGYNFRLNQDFEFSPSILFKYVTPSPIQADINAKLKYKNFIWGGLNLRLKEGYGILLGVNANHYFYFSYAYEKPTTNLKTLSTVSHEITLGFKIKSIGLST
jgi:type IX secretion system PorP/SprF family membrane protein